MKLMNSIRAAYAHIQLKRLRKQMEPQECSFPRDLLGTRHMLICLPPGLRELTMVKQFLPAIMILFRSAEITLLAMPGIKVTDIYPRKGVILLTPTVEQLNWAGLPKKSYIQTLQQQKFDLVLDMNLEQSLFTSAILLNFPKAVRIGRGNHLGIPYYNLEIKTKYLRDERNIYRSLLETLSALMNRKLEATMQEAV